MNSGCFEIGYTGGISQDERPDLITGWGEGSEENWDV